MRDWSEANTPLRILEFRCVIAMSCFSCLYTKERRKALEREILPLSAEKKEYELLSNKEHHVWDTSRRENDAYRNITNANRNITARSFTFRELAVATGRFDPEMLIGEGGFGRVYRGRIPSTEQLVAVKQLDKNGVQGNKEFLVEVLTLSLLSHPNLVHLVGYCAEGTQRVLVYEYMPMGSLDVHLLEIPRNRTPLSWYQRMKIAFGAALGLEYLHEKVVPPVIYRDLKCSNILLDKHYNPKLSDFGLAKLGPMGDNLTVSSRVMGTYGYCAPEYARTGQLNVKSDVYSFGVLMLQLLSARLAIDTTRATGEQTLVSWAQRIFKDQSKYKYLVDPRIRGCYPEKGLNQVVAVTIMCLQDEPAARPLMTDVVVALSHLTTPSKGENDITAPSTMHPASSTMHPQPVRDKSGPSTTRSQQQKKQLPEKYKTKATVQDINGRGKSVIEWDSTECDVESDDSS